MTNIYGTIRVGLAAAVASFLLVGCSPEYPSCDKDEQCKETEFCVDKKCQQCRTSDDCSAGFQCSEGACTAILGYCEDASACAAGQICAGNRCSSCGSDDECGSGLKCRAGSCQQPECSTDSDCPQDSDCVDGSCLAVAPQTPAGPPCDLASVYFGFDASTLDEAARSALADNVSCLSKAGGSVSLTGHADPRGTDEYNLALSDKRAQAVKKYLERLGVDGYRLQSLPRGSLDARGTNESSWARDRRVDLEWR